MPDERGEARLEKLRLEREETTEAIQRSLDLRDAPRLPSPDLRTDHMHRADAAGLCICGELEVHARVVNRADDVRTPCVNRPLERLLDLEEIEDPGQNRGKAHHRQVMRLEPIVPEATDLDIRPRPAQTLRNALRIKDTRLLPR